MLIKNARIVDGTGAPAYRGAISVEGERIAAIGLVAYIASVYPELPDVIPVHFGLNRVPNRWGGKVELLWFAGVAALFPALNAVFALKFGKYNKGVTAFFGFVFVLALGLFALIAHMMVQAA